MASEVIAIVTAEVNLINLICLVKPDPGSNVKHNERCRQNERKKYIPKANNIILTWQMIESSDCTQTIVTKACSLCATAVMLNENVMSQRHSEYLAGFRGKTQVSLWQSAHRFVLICFSDRCKSVEMLSQAQWLPSSLIGVTHRWPCNRDVIKMQSWPTGKLALLNLCVIVEATLLSLWVNLDCTMWDDKTEDYKTKNRQKIYQ